MKIQITENDIVKMIHSVTSKLLNESKADVEAIKSLAGNEKIIDGYARTLALNKSYDRNGRAMNMVDYIANEIAYDCQQKYGFCKTPSAMRNLVYDYLVPAVQKMAREKYGYQGSILQTADERKAHDDARAAQPLSEKAQAQLAKLSNNQDAMWAIGRRMTEGDMIWDNRTGRGKKVSKDDAVRNFLKDSDAWELSNELYKNEAKAFLKQCKKIFAGKGKLQESIYGDVNLDNDNELPLDDYNTKSDVQRLMRSANDYIKAFDMLVRWAEKKGVDKNKIAKLLRRGSIEAGFGRDRKLLRFDEAIHFFDIKYTYSKGFRGKSIISMIYQNGGANMLKPTFEDAERLYQEAQKFTDQNYVTQFVEEKYQECVNGYNDNQTARNDAFNKTNNEYSELFDAARNMQGLSFKKVYDLHDKAEETVRTIKEPEVKRHVMKAVNALNQRMHEMMDEAPHYNLGYANGWDEQNPDKDLVKYRELEKKYPSEQFYSSNGRGTSRYQNIYYEPNTGDAVAVVTYSVDSSD